MSHEGMPNETTHRVVGAVPLPIGMQEGVDAMKAIQRGLSQKDRKRAVIITDGPLFRHDAWIVAVPR